MFVSTRVIVKEKAQSVGRSVGFVEVMHSLLEQLYKCSESKRSRHVKRGEIAQVREKQMSHAKQVRGGSYEICSKRL